MHTAKCKFNTNVLSLPPVTVVRNRLCFKGFGGGGEEGNQFPGWAWLWPCSLRADPYPRPGPRTYSASSTGAAWAGRPSWGHGVFGFVRSSGPSTAAAEAGDKVFAQFRESLSCQRNHVATIQQMNSNNATVLGWPYLHWASQECQDFSIHKKCTSGTSCLCHFSCTPQSQTIHIVRGDSVFGLICASPLCSSWEQGNAPSPDIFLHRSVATFL